MARGKTKVLKKKAVVDQSLGGSQKGKTETGKGKRVPTQPPGSPQGKHHALMGREGNCHCGSCRNKELGHTYAQVR